MRIDVTILTGTPHRQPGPKSDRLLGQQLPRCIRQMAYGRQRYRRCISFTFSHERHALAIGTAKLRRGETAGS